MLWYEYEKASRIGLRDCLDILRGLGKILCGEMGLPVFCGRHTVFFLECPVKTGVIVESVLNQQAADGYGPQYGVFAGGQSFLQDILVNRQPNGILE